MLLSEFKVEHPSCLWPSIFTEPCAGQGTTPFDKRRLWRNLVSDIWGVTGSTMVTFSTQLGIQNSISPLGWGLQLSCSSSVMYTITTFLFLSLLGSYPRLDFLVCSLCFFEPPEDFPAFLLLGKDSLIGAINDITTFELTGLWVLVSPVFGFDLPAVCFISWFRWAIWYRCGHPCIFTACITMEYMADISVEYSTGLFE